MSCCNSCGCGCDCLGSDFREAKEEFDRFITLINSDRFECKYCTNGTKYTTIYEDVLDKQGNPKLTKKGNVRKKSVYKSVICERCQGTGNDHNSPKAKFLSFLDKYYVRNSIGDSNGV